MGKLRRMVTSKPKNEKQHCIYYLYDMRYIQVKDNLKHLYNKEIFEAPPFLKVRFAALLQSLNEMYGKDIENQKAF